MWPEIFEHRGKWCRIYAKNCNGTQYVQELDFQIGKEITLT